MTPKANNNNNNQNNNNNNNKQTEKKRNKNVCAFVPAWECKALDDFKYSFFVLFL